MLHCHIPDDEEVQTEISMNQTVAKINEYAPVNLRMFVSKIERKAGSRFTDKLKIADHGIYGAAIGEEFFAVHACGICLDALDGIGDVLNQ